MAIRKSSNTGIPFGNTANRPANPAVGQPYFNGQENRLEIYTQSVGWQNIVAETPGVVSYTGTVLETNSTNTLVISGTNFTTGAIASLIGNDGTEYIANTTTVNSIVQITAVFPAISASKEPYDIKVVNPSNLYGILSDVVSVNDKPVWATAAGSLGTFDGTTSVSTSPLAVSDEENNTITYSLLSGSLPGGLSLNSSTGVISGTATNPPSTTTYSFTLGASDGSNTAQQRTFSITINAIPVLTGGTLTSDSNYYYRTFTGNGTLSVSNTAISTDVLVIAGGGGGGSGWYAGGAGAGGVKLYSGLNLTTQNYPVVIGAGGAGTTDARYTSDNGQNSSFNTTNTALGGGGGGSRNQRTNGARVGGSGGSGGGAAFPQTLGGLGTSGQGFDGGSNSNGGYGASGGGAGSVGSSGTSPDPYGSNGGSGTNTYSSWLAGIASGMSGVSGWSSATSTGYIGGGGAGGSDSNILRTGGAGGGGNGAQGTSAGATNGIANTGGGGGGGSGTENDSTLNAPQRGATGGSGLVVVRYLKSAVGG